MSFSRCQITHDVLSYRFRDCFYQICQCLQRQQQQLVSKQYPRQWPFSNNSLFKHNPNNGLKINFKLCSFNFRFKSCSLNLCFFFQIVLIQNDKTYFDVIFFDSCIYVSFIKTIQYFSMPSCMCWSKNIAIGKYTRTKQSCCVVQENTLHILSKKGHDTKTTSLCFVNLLKWRFNL